MNPFSPQRGMRSAPKGRPKNAILTATSQKKPKHGPDTDNFIKKLSPPPIMPDLNLSEMFGDFDSVTNESTLTPDRPESISKWRAENCNYDSHISPMQKKPKTGADSENFNKKLSPPQNEISEVHDSMGDFDFEILTPLTNDDLNLDDDLLLSFISPPNPQINAAAPNVRFNQQNAIALAKKSPPIFMFMVAL